MKKLFGFLIALAALIIGVAALTAMTTYALLVTISYGIDYPIYSKLWISIPIFAFVAFFYSLTVYFFINLKKR